MASIVNNDSSFNDKNNIPVSEQMLLVNFVISLIKASDEFKNLDVGLNFLSSSEDCICIRLLNNNVKIHEYVDGSYEGQIMFALIYRRMNVSNIDERSGVISSINKFGETLENQDYFDIESDSITINSISQSTNAGLMYRDDSGIEDNGANFILRYDKD